MYTSKKAEEGISLLLGSSTYIYPAVRDTDEHVGHLQCYPHHALVQFGVRMRLQRGALSGRKEDCNHCLAIHLVSA